jgi:glutamine kinase
MIRYKPKFSFGTKAETLERLKPLLLHSQIPDILFFDLADWEVNFEHLLQKIRTYFADTHVIVRSSAHGEDGDLTTMAGAHDSIPDVHVDNINLLHKSIKKVISSYERFNNARSQLDQVLIQRMINNISTSGVVFTQDMNTGAPYYVINYDDQTGRTDTVTCGGQHSNRTLLIHRENGHNLHSERFKSLLKAVQEIEEITKCSALDIEFAVGWDNEVYIFQVRKITTQANWNRGLSIKVNDAILRVESFVSERFRPIEGIYGSRSILGRMPDWNPAEMIGVAPRPLSLSLYRFLITDRSWRVARSQMGYAEPKGTQLMVSLSGQPYIDVRLSFHSLIPADLPSQIADKLVNAYLDRLSENKEFHDKVEFDVAITVLAFDFEESFEKCYQGILSKEEKETFKQSLFRLTNTLITGQRTPIEGELEKIDKLDHERARFLHGINQPELITAFALLEDCIRFGTIPFSVLARHAFIAKSILTSLTKLQILTEAEALSFLGSIKTVASDLVVDIERLNAGEVSKREFMKQYGHLRPGTYDILSLRYDQREDLIGGKIHRHLELPHKDSYSLSSSQIKEIKYIIEKNGFDISPEDLFLYIRNAITSREYAKFVFTKNISDALELIAVWGEQVGLSREEISVISISDIREAASSAHGRTIEQHLRDKSVIGRENHAITLSLRLPYIIDSPEDVSIIPLLISKPNYITHKTIRAAYKYINGREGKPPELSGKIILIEGADPGFDWIFSCSIAGLVTKYGGANSHMAIRCAEFRLPAAIGCGEQTFDRILRSRSLEINCSEGRIVPLDG